MKLVSRIVCALFLSIITHNARAATWYVATNGNDGADGTNWATAKQTIQAGIDLAAVNDTVLVSNGVYSTGGYKDIISGLTNRILLYQPVIVQSVNGPTNTIIQGVGPSGNGAVRCSCLVSGASLVGFTLINGHTRTNGFTYMSDSTNYFDKCGGGIFAYPGAVVSNCIVTGCSSFDSPLGGAVSGGRLDGCTLSGNSALGSSGSGGGAGFSVLYNCNIISNRADSAGGGVDSCDLYNCALFGNSASNRGGGTDYSTLYNCTVIGNTAEQGGGAYDSTLHDCALVGNGASSGGGSAYNALYNCTVISNTAAYGGGAYNSTLYNCSLIGNSATNIGGGAAYSTLYNCTLTSNSAGMGGGVYNGTLYNSIVYFNTASLDDNFRNSQFTNSCTTPLPPGAGNITNNPQFVNATGRNYHLKAGSPCTDKGSNLFAQGTVDLDGNPRILNGIVDMGAYEYQYNAGYWAWAGAITNGLTNFGDCATGDGYPNLLKFATGSSPTNSDALARMGGVQTNGVLMLQFNRNTNAADTTLIVEAANSVSNGSSWSGIATNINGSWGGATNVAEVGTTSPVSVTVADSSPATNRFLRLRVSRP